MSENDWLLPLKALLSADSDDLRLLADIVGADPRIFYVGQNLSGCDLRDQDLRGMDLSGTQIEFALLNDRTLIDEVYDPRLDEEGFDEKIQIRLREDVYALGLAYSDKSHYIYRAWALKSLLEYGSFFYRDPETIEFFSKNENFFDFAAHRPNKTRRITLNLSPKIRATGQFLSRELGNDLGFNYLMMTGLVYSLRLIHTGKDYSSLNPSTLLPNFGKYLEGIQSGKRFITP